MCVISWKYNQKKNYYGSDFDSVEIFKHQFINEMPNKQSDT